MKRALQTAMEFGAEGIRLRCAGRLGGAALDVLSVEPPPADHPLLAAGLPNLLITPHCAWISRGARQVVEVTSRVANELQ